MAKDTKGLIAHWKQYPCEQWLTSPLVKVFATSVGLNKPTDEQIPHRSQAYVVRLRGESKTALAVRDDGEHTTFIPHMPHGLCVESMPSEAFNRDYEPVLDYPTGRCAMLFARYGAKVGATTEAMAELGKLITIDKADLEEATTKLSKNKSAKTSAGKAKKLKRGERAPRKKRKGSNTAAGMIQRLIMEDKWSDTEIFEQVQKVFGLDDSKRTYVSVQRSYLKRTGKKPPPRKKG